MEFRGWVIFHAKTRTCRYLAEGDCRIGMPEVDRFRTASANASPRHACRKFRDLWTHLRSPRRLKLRLLWSLWRVADRGSFRAPTIGERNEPSRPRLWGPVCR